MKSINLPEIDQDKGARVVGRDQLAENPSIK